MWQISKEDGQLKCHAWHSEWTEVHHLHDYEWLHFPPDEGSQTNPLQEALVSFQEVS